MFAIQKRGGFSLFNPFFSIDCRSQELCEIYFISWQSFLKLIFRNKADEDKHSLYWSGMEAESHGPS